MVGEVVAGKKKKKGGRSGVLEMVAASLSDLSTFG